MNPGDIVRLKSGSPRLTVEYVGSVTVTVVWIGYSTHELHRADVRPEALVADAQARDIPL